MSKKTVSNKTFRLLPFLASNFNTLFRMLKAYGQGRYRIIPYSSIVKIIIGVAYIFFIIDLIPDFIPLAGWLDDIAVSAWVLHSIKKDIQRFRNWERGG